MHPDHSPANCPVCKMANIGLWAKAIDYEYFSVSQQFSYYQCSDCDTIFIYPIPVELLNQIYPPNYYSFVKHPRNPVARIKEWMDNNFFRKVLKKIKSGTINVLDVGGGTGWLLSNLKKTDKRVVSTQVVDIDANAGIVATGQGHEYFQGTIEAFNTEKRYDLILMLNLVEHVADPLAVMKKVESLLTPGGIILIKTPNTKSWDAHLFRKTYWGGLHCPRHWIIFSEKSFRTLISSTSLHIKKLKYTQGAPFWAFSIIAALHRKKWVKISTKKPIIFHWLFAPISAMFAMFDFIRRPFAKTSQMFIILEKTDSFIA